MKVEQVYQLVNLVTNEVLGKEDVLLEDLSNVVDVGTQIFDANAMDSYVKSLINHIGKVIFVNRPYSGSVPSLLRDSWEFGSILEKVQMDIPEATENETWELEDGAVYEENIFYKPKVSAKFFNKKVTFEVPISITERQVKQSFIDAVQLNAFISMIYSAVDRSMTIKIDGLAMQGLNNLIAETVHSDYPTAQYSATSGVRAINLLKLYNDRFEADLTAENCITNAEFIRFASYTMGVYSDRLARVSSLFNVEGKDRFTPADLLHFVLLSDFAKASNSYLQSEAFHNEFTRLPNAETVPYWQGSGKTYSWNDITKINVKTSSNDTVEITGVLGIMFDRDAVGVTNYDRRVTSKYNAKAEFWNNWNKFDCGLFVDLQEQAVVFFVA